MAQPPAGIDLDDDVRTLVRLLVIATGGALPLPLAEVDDVGLVGVLRGGILYGEAALLTEAVEVLSAVRFAARVAIMPRSAADYRRMAQIVLGWTEDRARGALEETRARGLLKLPAEDRPS